MSEAIEAFKREKKAIVHQFLSDIEQISFSVIDSDRDIPNPFFEVKNAIHFMEHYILERERRSRELDR